MKAKLCFTILAVAMLAALVAPPLAGAETMKWRAVQFYTKGEVLQIGGVPDHIIGIYDQIGLASFETGEVASHDLKGTLDYTKGSGPIQGYAVYTFEDGSTMTIKYQATTRPELSGKGSRWEGTWTYIQGTGRFAGIQGDGTMMGRRFVPFGGGAQAYTDFTGKYTLPPK